jgi:small subunit ribosomal protein S17
MVGYDRKIRAHDEADEARVGDTVEVTECRPMSRTKRWRLVRILERNPEAGAASAVGAGADAPSAPPQDAGQAAGDAAS